MEALLDLIEEAKVMAVWWALCIFVICYIISHTSKSIWSNVPVSLLILCALRYLSYKVDIYWKKQLIKRPSYISHIEKRQTTLEDHKSTSLPPWTSWKEKVNSPPVEDAIRNFVNKLLQDFVVDLWYSALTPDKEAPALIRALIFDAIGAISARIRETNLELLIRDVVELVCNHLDLFRRNKSTITVEVIRNMSLEQIDEKLKYHLLASAELHPALVSSECEYKFLQKLVGGVLAIVLEIREAQSSLVQCFSREILTCLVLQPVMNLANPANINELIEVLCLALRDEDSNAQLNATKEDHKILPNLKPTEWARMSDAAKQRSEVPGFENVEDAWTNGRIYEENTNKLFPPRSMSVASGVLGSHLKTGPVKESPTDSLYVTAEDKYVHSSAHVLNSSIESCGIEKTKFSNEGNILDAEVTHSMYGSKNKVIVKNNHQIKRSSSMTDLKLKDNSYLKVQKNNEAASSSKNEDFFDYEKLCNPCFLKPSENSSTKQDSKPLTYSEGSLHAPKLKCRVVGASYEKIGSKSFAVYYLAVGDAEKAPWFVKRRYRNFERLHRFLKDIPNYTLHLPPKRFLSSNIDDYFVHKRCILLDKYLQDLLTIPNVAERHEVWDFLSAYSKNYSYGKSTSVMKTLAVNVDDAMDDIVRQFKGVSDGIKQKIVSSPSSSYVYTTPNKEENITLSHNEQYMTRANETYIETPQSLSDEDIHDEEDSSSANAWLCDNEFMQGNLTSLRRELGNASLDQDIASNSLSISNLIEDQSCILSELSSSNLSVVLVDLVDNIFQMKQGGWLRKQHMFSSSVKKYEASRHCSSKEKNDTFSTSTTRKLFTVKSPLKSSRVRPVPCVSKDEEHPLENMQILHLMMGNAFDEWLLRQIDCLRRDHVIAQGILWVQDVLWPNGTFFKKLELNQTKEADSPHGHEVVQNASISFEQNLQAARRASDVKKIILDGAPATLVNLVGPKQYEKCAEDIYQFLQSTICIKQLAYGALELLLISVFPELLDLVQDIHQISLE